MSNSTKKSLKCCETREEKFPEVGVGTKISDLMPKFNEDLQASTAACSSCIDPIILDSEVSEDGQKSAKRMCLSPSEENPQKLRELRMEEPPWDTIIVNQIPLKFDLEKFTSVFSDYGSVDELYLCKDNSDEDWAGNKYERIARVRFRHEEDARKVWLASQAKLIKLDDEILMITLISNNYTPIENLPDDCLREIFYRLPVEDKLHVEKVSKRWKIIGSQSWSNVNKIRNGWTSDAWKTIAPRTANVLRDLILRLPEEEATDYENYDDDSPYVTMALIAEHCTRFERLGILWYSDFLDESCDEYSEYIPHLHPIISKNQQLRIVHLQYVLLDEGFFDWLPGGMEEIHVRCDGKNWGSPLNVAPVDLARFPNLQSLALFGFKINEDQLRGIEYLDNLRTLKLDDSDVHPSNIEGLVNCRKLEHLAISRCQISNLALIKILKNNQDLTYLDLSDIEGVRDSSFQYVLQLPKLEVLWMKNLQKVSSFSAMPKLKTLKAHGCSSLTNEEIQRLFTRDSVLEELNISECSVSLYLLITAFEFVTRVRPGHKPLHIHVDRKMEHCWRRICSKESSTMILLNNPTVFVRVYDSENDFDNPPEDDWSEFDRFDY